MSKIQVRVQPGASQEKIEAIEQNGQKILKIWVKAKPVDGQANKAAIKALAKHLGIKPRQIKLVSGHTSKNKIFEITD